MTEEEKEELYFIKKGNKIYLNDVYTKDLKKIGDTIKAGDVICLDIRWIPFTDQIERGICVNHQTGEVLHHESLINPQGFVNLVLQRKRSPYKKITHDVYNNDHKPNEKI